MFMFKCNLLYPRICKTSNEYASCHCWCHSIFNVFVSFLVVSMYNLVFLITVTIISGDIEITMDRWLLIAE